MSFFLLVRGGGAAGAVSLLRVVVALLHQRTDVHARTRVCACACWLLLCRKHVRVTVCVCEGRHVHTLCTP